MLDVIAKMKDGIAQHAFDRRGISFVERKTAAAPCTSDPRLPHFGLHDALALPTNSLGRFANAVALSSDIRKGDR